MQESQFGLRRPSNLRELPLLFSLRGLALLALVIFMVTGPVTDGSDIVASVLSFCLLGIVLTLALISGIKGTFLKRAVTISLGVPATSEYSKASNELQANKPIRFFLALPALKLPYLFELEAQIRFFQPGVSTILHKISGRPSGLARAYEDIIFPHRGAWQVSHCDLKFGDQLGVSAVKWKQALGQMPQSFKIGFAEEPISQLPVLSSCHRAGDTVSDIQERHGDLFDLKQYHPSDGVKRIVWKLFAKSGQLIARHPEKAMTPEGQVVIFCLANLHEDYVCGSALAYVRQLEDLDLEIFLGCEGKAERSVARSSEQTRALLIDSVWDTVKTTPAGLQKELDDLLAETTLALHGGSVERLIVFMSAKRVVSEKLLEEVVSLGERLGRSGIAPIFIVCEPVSTRNISHLAPQSGLISTLLFESSATRQEIDSEYHQRFLKICADRKWQVILNNFSN
ncbi:MAG: DUF58 domain-containing protein [Bdellovibrionales bacterium]|nr:DUF58 domain-containing protein [Bdellovibrionales bacterium]